jgi:hypothetical protein
MATLNKAEVIAALTRVGELAVDSGQSVELLLLGGSLMVLVFGTRDSTRDVDVVILRPQETSEVRKIGEAVARERDLPLDWLNDAAKGFLIGPPRGPVVFTSPGIVVRRPSFEQLLAMKLCAWRDDLDVADARRLLLELPGAYDEVWQKVTAYLQPGRELTARYAFDDLWDELHGPH